MEAFQEAIDLGYKYLETDIQVTSDNKLVIFHDDKLEQKIGTKERKMMPKNSASFQNNEN